MATLVVDCGGTGLKAALFDEAGHQVGERLRVDTPYPLSPARLADSIAELGVRLERQFAEHRPGASTPITRVTVGMPGMIRHGRVVFTPHYINSAGAFSAVDPGLAATWAGCDIEAIISARLGVPVKVVNDAELHGLGVISGVGSELVLTLGTGLGSAWFDDGVLAPHLELSHAPVRIGEMVLGQGRRPSITFDGFIGDHELRRLGVDHWSDRVLAVVDSLRPVFRWDRLYLGGGNANQIAAWARDRLPDDVVLVPNDAALVGGLRLWGGVAGRSGQPRPTSLATSFGETIIF